MTFLESAIFPDDIAYGSSVVPGYRNLTPRSPGGARQVIQKWSQPLLVFDARYGVRELDQLYSLREFWWAVEGSANEFRFKDHADFTSDPVTPFVLETDAGNVALPAPSSPTDQLIGTGDGTTVQFQLVKVYSAGGVSKVRPIRKPVAGTVTIAFDGVEQTSGWSVNTTNGVVLFTTAPTTGVVITAGFEYDVPCAFTEQADRALAMRHTSFSAGDMPSIGVEEVREPSMYVDHKYHGGAKNFGVITSDQQVTPLDGAALVFEQAQPLNVFLSPESDWPSGGPLLVIHNRGANVGDILTIQSDGGGYTIGAIDKGQNLIISASKNAAGFRTFYGV